MGSNKKEISFFRAKHCAKKGTGSKKYLIFFRAKNCAKKSMGAKKSAKKKYELQKHGHSDSYFFGPNIVTKKYGFQKKQEFILFQAKHCARKKIWVPKKKDEFQEKHPFFFLLFFLEPYFFWHNVWPEKSMSSVFLELILFLALCWARKKYEFLFFGTHTFFGTMFGPKKV